METFHEVLPDNLVFFHFHYIGTKEIKPMDYTIVLYVKNCISEENYTSGVQTLPQTFRDQAVSGVSMQLKGPYDFGQNYTFF